MTRKIYRTAQGKMVDLGRLQLQNENTRAVGNMKVNARGDLIDSNNRAIENRKAQVGRQYNRQISNVERPQGKNQKTAPVDIPAPPEDFQDDFEKPEISAPEPAQSAEPAAGLAAAIARARQVKQEPIKSPRQLSQQQPGVRKL